MKRRQFLGASSAVLAFASVGAWYWPQRWDYIVVHHSAGDFGNIEFLQKVHRERQAKDPVDAIPYHYIIGNGNGLGLGEVDSDWRETFSIWGAHVSRNNSDRNFRGLGICLIGNYEKHAVPDKQYAALVDLTRTLMQKYGIPVNHVTGHGLTAGESTKCPGKNFPMAQFLADIASTGLG
ncbi:hypothetical protein A9Q99_22190 [Gammaproteobacteria bacterium 45_16_T64]|nr:hypothetical protein A9Q99_22190 [Gammaproteobacteria bacterium 45_16_T64]